MDVQNRLFRVRLFIACSLALCGFCLLAFMVNSDAALGVMLPHWRGSRALLPAAIYAFFSRFAVDLSLVSTLVPLLVVLFPLIKAIRVWRRGADNEEVLRDCALYTYPDRFGFFLIMLGLVGTLYGMLIGLSVSGVADLGDSVLAPADISRSLDRLLRGTATALWSSLVGIIGAFCVVLPVPALIRWVIRLPREEADLGLVGTIEHLRKDLDRLAVTSRALADSFTCEGFASVQASARVMGRAAEALATGVDKVVAPLEKSLELQERTAATLAELPALRAGVEALGQKVDLLQARFDEPLGLQERILERLAALEELAKGVDKAQNAMGRIEGVLEKLDSGACSRRNAEREEAVALLAAMRGVGETAEKDREHFRRAMALYSGAGK